MTHLYCKLVEPTDDKKLIYESDIPKRDFQYRWTKNYVSYSLRNESDDIPNKSFTAYMISNSVQVWQLQTMNSGMFSS